MFKYRLYGLIAYSDIPLYNICQTDGEPDIFICREKISLSDEIKFTKGLYYSENIVYVLTDLAVYAISHGERITVDSVKDAESVRLTAFIIGWGLSILFTQRKYSSLHCTAIDINGKGVLISGPSGSGKSSLALSLCKRGYKYLADDIVMINPKENMNIIPAYPLQKICHDKIDGIDNRKLLYISRERNKYAYLNTENFCDSPRNIDSLFILQYTDSPSVEIEEINGLKKYLRILGCLFLNTIYVDLGLPECDKYNCLELAGHARLFNIYRPHGKNTVDEITDKIISIINN